MTQDQFNKMFATAMQQYRQELRDNDCGEWSQKARAYAVEKGIFVGGGLELTASPTSCGRTFSPGSRRPKSCTASPRPTGWHEREARADQDAFPQAHGKY